MHKCSYREELKALAFGILLRTRDIISKSGIGQREWTQKEFDEWMPLLISHIAIVLSMKKIYLRMDKGLREELENMEKFSDNFKKHQERKLNAGEVSV